MAVHTGLSHRSFHISRRMKSCAALFPFSMTSDAVHIRRKHQTGGVWNADPPTPPVQLSGSQMDFLAMALITDGRGVDHRKDRANLMPNVRMAIGAFDLMIRDMIPVHELGGIPRGQ
jgi:hypothetical protein